MSYEDALIEAYASAPLDELVLVTLEIHHPTFVDDHNQLTAIRVVQAFKDYQFRLESTAPLNPGQMVTFQKCAFEFQEPGFSEKKVPTLPLVISGVSREITQYLENAIQSRAPIVVYMRPYLASDPDQPQMDPPYRFEMTKVMVDVFQVSGECNLKDVYNAGFPSDVYTTDVFGGLRS